MPLRRSCLPHRIVNLRKGHSSVTATTHWRVPSSVQTRIGHQSLWVVIYTDSQGTNLPFKGGGFSHSLHSLSLLQNWWMSHCQICAASKFISFLFLSFTEAWFPCNKTCPFWMHNSVIFSQIVQPSPQHFHDLFPVQTTTHLLCLCRFGLSKYCMSMESYKTCSFVAGLFPLCSLASWLLHSFLRSQVSESHLFMCQIEIHILNITSSVGRY